MRTRVSVAYDCSASCRETRPGLRSEIAILDLALDLGQAVDLYDNFSRVLGSA